MRTQSPNPIRNRYEIDIALGWEGLQARVAILQRLGRVDCWAPVVSVGRAENYSAQ